MITVHEVKEPTAEDISPFDERNGKHSVIAVKGAPDVVLDLCSIPAYAEER